MTRQKPGVAAALDAVGGPGEPPRDDAEQLPLLPDMREKPVSGGEETANSEADAPRGPGRPKGARNKRTQEIAEYIGGRYGMPLERLAQLWSADPHELAAKYEINPADAVRLMKDAAVAGLPYLHQKKPVEVDVTDTKSFTIIVGDITGSEEQVETAALEGISLVLEKDPKTGVFTEKDQDKSKG